jgi:disulfide reductase
MIDLKKYILIFIIGVIFTSCADNNIQAKNNDLDELNWLTNLEEAVKIAQKEDKPIFVNFTGSDWCGWCFKLDAEVFSQQEFITFAQEQLVLLELDFPRNIPQTDAVKDYNRALLDKFKVKGFPTILLLDKTGKEIERTGYQSGGAANYVLHIKKLIG